MCIRLPLHTLMICMSLLSSLVEVSFINAAFITTALEMFYSTNVKHWFLFTFEIWSCIIVSLSFLFELRDIVNNLLTSFSWTALSYGTLSFRPCTGYKSELKNFIGNVVYGPQTWLVRGMYGLLVNSVDKYCSKMVR